MKEETEVDTVKYYSPASKNGFYQKTFKGVKESETLWIANRIEYSTKIAKNTQNLSNY